MRWRRVRQRRAAQKLRALRNLPDNCQVCAGSKGGVRGNENIIGGRIVCDYCHADGSYLKAEG